MVYLKQVTAHGFKSFADKTTVNFDAGVTAIVGPNGSGKSNITDAIKWVLGEQSAKSLRGSKMEDVIFSGAQDRKPQNYAEVTLSIDNSERRLNIDSNIVEVTRKLYRNGDSEYLLNKQRSRLKDVTELFLDSGLGRDAFSMISQGKVDQVLNAKPEDRRQLIEEAAGVLKYKKRKKETEAKLEDTNMNLTRVHDIIYDLKDRVEPLKIEASIAEEYLALSEEMKDADIQVTIADIETARETYEKVKVEIDEFNALIKFKSEKSDRLGEKLIDNKEQLKMHQTTVNDHHQALLTCTEQIERYIGEINVLKERLHNQSISKSKRNEQIGKYETQIREYEGKINTLHDELKALKTEQQQIKKDIKVEKEKLLSLDTDLETIIDDTRDKYYEKLSEQTNLSNEIKLIEKEIEQFDQKQARQTSIHQDITQAYDTNQNEIGALTEEIKKQTDSLNNTREKYKSQLSEIEQIKTDYQKKHKDYMQATQYIESLKGKQERLLVMQEEFQGYYQGVRMLLKNKNKLNGIHSTVLDAISVDLQYSDALDAALGTSLQHIIVDDAHSGSKAIQFLRQNKYGRATFLPLNVIKPRKISSDAALKLQTMDGYISTLNSLIKSESKYQHIVDNLAGTVIVTETLNDANKVAKAIDFKYRIVTLEGDIINPGGSMSGGSKNKPSQALTARNDLQHLTAQLEKFEQSTIQLKSELDTKSEEITTLEMASDQLRLKGEALRDELHRQKLSLEEANEKSRRLKVANEEQINMLQEAEYIEARKQLIVDYQTQINALKSELETLNENLKSFTVNASDKKALQDNINEIVNAKQHQLAVIETNISHQQSLITDLKDRLDQVKQEIHILQADDRAIDIEEVQQNITLKEKALMRLNDEKTQFNEQIELENEKINEISALVESLDQENNELLRQISGIENGVGELKGKHSSINVQLDNLINHLSEQYGKTYEAAKDYLWEQLGISNVFDSDLSYLRKRVRLTKISIEELGNVNLNAIEQYKAVGERYEFLTNQEADLLEAKANLESIIQDMDETVSEKFIETFNTVAQSFEKIFKQLFGGGIGKLQLTSEDVLTAGIDIFVEPPGKRRQNLSLLSGGERALTAIVLLFSILQARSAPFVILDEVEAALDEANVNRFAEFLNTLTYNTQFIVITHRKGTMEKSDRLYGVTMQNSGITQLVSVNLKELDDKKLKELTK